MKPQTATASGSISSGTSQSVPVSARSKSSNHSSMQRTWGVILLAVYLCGTFYLTHSNLKGSILDHANYPGRFANADKLFHFASYFGLTFLIMYFFSETRKTKNTLGVSFARKRIVWSLLIVAYGIFDEVTQPYFGRRLELFDLLANIVGIIFAQAAFFIAGAGGIRHRLLRAR